MLQLLQQAFLGLGQHTFVHSLREELPMHDDALLVSVPTFARRIGLSDRTVWKLVRRDAVPVLRIGRRTLIPVAEGLEALRRLAEPPLGPPNKAHD